MKRLILVLLASLAVLPVLAQSSECHSAKHIDAALQDISADPKRQMAALDARLSAQAAALGWSTERQRDLRAQALSSDAYWSFEREKQPHVMALSKAVASSSGPDPQTSKCEAARQVQALAGKLADINRRQYAQAARDIGLAKEAAK